MQKHDYLRISSKEMFETFYNILLKNGLPDAAAKKCADVFTQTSVDGVYTHGVNRFARFICYIQSGSVNINTIPVLKQKFNAVEQWDGKLGAGITNAIFATEQSMQLATQFGIGCVALANTNHWMRGGTYAWQAAKSGFIFIGWTNTIANMPAWNASNVKLGNNPLVIAMPYKKEAIVLDMAMSQYSYGKLELMAMNNEMLPVSGGFNIDGELTNNPADIIASNRVLPAGYWKGAGLSLLLDILAAVLSGGLAVNEISKKSAEISLSQVFISIDINKMGNNSALVKTVENIITDYKNSAPVNVNDNILYPGERVLATRKQNMEDGIPVLKTIWNAIVQLN